jgi:hypothetical protein
MDLASLAAFMNVRTLRHPTAVVSKDIVHNAAKMGFTTYLVERQASDKAM